MEIVLLELRSEVQLSFVDVQLRVQTEAKKLCLSKFSCSCDCRVVFWVL